MADRVSQAEINDIAWRACDTFRGTIDPAQYKDYILVMLFLKYLSDVWKDKTEEYEKEYQGRRGAGEAAAGARAVRDAATRCDLTTSMPGGARPTSAS